MKSIRRAFVAVSLLIGILTGTAHAALNAYLNLAPNGIVSPRDSRDVVLYVKMQKFVGKPAGKREALLSSSPEALKKDNPLLSSTDTQIMVIAVSHEALAGVGLTEAGLRSPRLISLAIGALVLDRPDLVNVSIDLR
jgi:hypothetical protein